MSNKFQMEVVQTYVSNTTNRFRLVWDENEDWHWQEELFDGEGNNHWNTTRSFSGDNVDSFLRSCVEPLLRTGALREEEDE